MKLMNFIIICPTRPVSNTLIDNIFINSLEFESVSGNLTIQLSDHLFQFVILEGFFKERPHKPNVYERNFKDFNEREFEEILIKINWDDILSPSSNHPILSMDNYYNHIIFFVG